MISPRWLLNEIKQEMVKMAKCYIDV